MANRIQERMDDDVADIPLFHGNSKDTINASTFINRIEQGIESLAWTPAQAYMYFRNALRSDADDWIAGILYLEPNIVRNWTIFRPRFSQEYEISSIRHTFIHKVTSVTLAACDNKLNKYVRQIGETINGAKDVFIHPVVPAALPVDAAVFPAASNAVHLAYLNGLIRANTDTVFEFLAAETYIDGLPQLDYDKLKNKVLITTTHQMHTYLVNDRALKAAQPNRANARPALPAPAGNIAPVENDDDVSAVRPGNNGANRNGNNRRNNGNRNNGNNGNGRAERNSQNGQRNGYNGQNNGRNGNQGNYMNNDPRGQNGKPSARPYKFSQNGKPICHHCELTGHMQKQCRARISAKKPCVKPDGTTWFPILSASDQDSIESVFHQ